MLPSIDDNHTSSTKLSSVIVVRPVCFFILLAIIVLLLPSLVIPYWIIKVKRIEQEVKLISRNLSHEVLSEIEKTAQLFSQVNSSATNLARVLRSNLDGVNLSVSSIQTSVAPVLFQALSTIPHLSQISYIGLDGLFFSYYTNGYQHSAVYSNCSLFGNMTISSATTKYTSWYTQPVNRDTGKLYGEASSSNPLITVNASWFQEALVRKNGYSSLGTGWENAQDLLFLNTAGIDRRGVISLGFPVKSLSDLFSGIDCHGGNLYLATRDGKVLGEGIPNTRLVLVGDSVSFKLLNPNGTQIGYVGNVTCKPEDDTMKASLWNIWETKYMIYCSPIDIAGVQSVYVLALPQKGLETLVEKNIMFGFMLLILMFGAMVVSIVAFVFLIVRAARREMYLCAALIKQMEATQQAERKSLNKSNAFASANHDVRASLAGINGLIEMCREEVAPGSELETNLMQMEACTKDLMGILNSILDKSKIEAGKMQLEEEEFDLAQLLEDVVDFYHPVGMKKGVDVVLDPCDGSISKFSKIKGDRTKIKQILFNLLSNAVKFTPEGHVAVRAWAKKPTGLDNLTFSSGRNSSLRCLSCLFLKNDEGGLETVNTVRENASCVEFVFEVDDTGQGIPKEKQSSVFENYVQVTGRGLGQEGTGLGLGIVQSLVRLMGGEIGIVDKEIGEKGTCFRFNIFLITACEADSSAANAKGDVDVESHGGYVSGDSFQHSGISTRATSPKQQQQQQEGGSHVVLFLQSDTRRRMSQKFMESLGIKVSAVKEWEQLPQTLKKIKHKLNLSRCSSSSGRSDASSRSDQMSRTKDVPLSAMDGTDQINPPLQKKRTNLLKGVPKNFILIVMDTNAGPFRELSRAVAEFKRDLIHNTTCCRIIWIDKPGARNIPLDDDKLPPTDLIISKPFHGSRLYHVIGLLPEFGGILPGTRENTYPLEKKVFLRSRSKKKNAMAHHFPSEKPSSSGREVLVLGLQKGEIIQEHGSTSNEKPLSGKKLLVAEDNIVLRKLATSNISRLGANVESCENGEEALQLVCKGLSDQRKLYGVKGFLPYDYILMDCEMPVMDGFEATRRIREEEIYYGVHIPIIALTAHATGEETSRMMKAGMDFHLAKPLKREQLMEAITYIHSN